MAVIAMLLMASPATAAGPDPDDIDDLQRIAGQGASYAPVGADPTQRSAGLDPFRCTLYPSVVHARTSSRFGSVGAKPYTRCLAGSPRIISQTSTLYIVEFAGLRYKPMNTRTATSKGVKSLEQKNVEWFCRNRNVSRFQQETKGYSVQAGRTYQTVVITRRTDLNCGY